MGGEGYRYISDGEMRTQRPFGKGRGELAILVLLGTAGFLADFLGYDDCGRDVFSLMGLMGLFWTVGLFYRSGMLYFISWFYICFLIRLVLSILPLALRDINTTLGLSTFPRHAMA